MAEHHTHSSASSALRALGSTGPPLFVLGGSAKSPAQTGAAAVGMVAIRHWEPDVVRHTPRPSSAKSARLATRIADVGGPI